MCEACRKCNKWVKLCGRKDSKFKSIRNVTKDTYICSLHFFGDSGSTEEYPDPIECRPKTIKEKTQKSRRSLEQKYQRFSLKSEESTSTIGSSCFTGKEKSRETNSTDVEFEEVKAFRDPEPNFSTEMQSMDMESKSNDRGQAFSSTETQTNFETLHELEGMESTTDAQEEIATKKVAKERIYVEHAVGRLKQFRILQRTIPLSMRGIISQLVFVCACLINFQEPIVYDEG
ncbi:uncharacterized protein LOC117176010 isoform X3 [Belonocnema kinseyi]|uniref:uncharacterized protein LOC117176010 isoform X3 n=1 Tax=Belonocnema kinseyi TaxID=2817044 RepID=UPI00143DC964|nr:uncharacterized protein LOC117176010 isoform X3 [Belonocnema kinseyi]